MDCNEIISQISERQQRIKSDMMLYSGNTKNISNQTPLDRDFKDSYKIAKSSIYKERNSREYTADILASIQSFPQKTFDNAIFEEVVIEDSHCEYRNNALVFSVKYRNDDNSAVLFTKSGLVLECNVIADNNGVVKTKQYRFNVVSKEEHFIDISVAADIQDIVIPANLIRLDTTIKLCFKPMPDKDDTVMLLNSQIDFTVFIGDSVIGDSDEFVITEINNQNVIVGYRENEEKVIIPNTVDEAKLVTKGSENNE